MPLSRAAVDGSAPRDVPVFAIAVRVTDYLIPAAATAAAFIVLAITRALHSVSWLAVVFAVALISALCGSAAGVMRGRRDASMDAVISDLQAIVGGDLRVRTEITSEGQLRELEIAVRDIVAEMRGLVSAADRCADLLAGGWHTMNEVAWSMMNASEGTVLEVNAAARAASEVSQSIQFIASATEETPRRCARSRLMRSMRRALANPESNRSLSPARASKTCVERRSESRRSFDLSTEWPAKRTCWP